jgi:Ran GTPase-activating protein (RanGAP) involved in mRNA processing and transport
LALIMDALNNHATKICKLNFARTSTWDLNDSTRVFLSSNHTLTVLNLESNFLRDSGVQLLCLALGENESPALEKVYLANNDFGDGGAFALAKLLGSNISIQVLGIGENAIDTIGAECMLHALKCNGSIRVIVGLYTNKIADKSIILAIESRLEESIERTFYQVLTSREKEHPSSEVRNKYRGRSSLTEIRFSVDEDGQI